MSKQRDNKNVLSMSPPGEEDRKATLDVKSVLDEIFARIIDINERKMLLVEAIDHLKKILTALVSPLL